MGVRFHNLVLTSCLLVAAVWSAPANAAGPYEEITTIIFLKTIKSDTAITLYERVVGKTPGTRLVRRDERTLVVHDLRSRVARFTKLLAVLDLPSKSKVGLYIRPVIHRRPSELAALLDKLLADERSGAPLHIIADDRSGQLIVRATPATYATLDKLARRLDVPGRGGKKIRVLPAPDDMFNQTTGGKAP